MNSLLGQALLISLMGMAVTFFALGLVMTSMFLLTRLAKDREGTETGVNIEEHQNTGEPSIPLSEAAFDIELPSGSSLKQVAAAAVAVATTRELVRRRHSAQVWLSPQPRSLLSPWQIVARDKQLDRIKQ